MPVRRDAKLGRIALVTVEDTISEALGDSIETVGGGVVAGSRRPRPFRLTLPVYGDSQEADPYLVGERLRRQVRSLLENTEAKLESLYFRFLVDPDQNGWLLVGGGDLQYGAGGVTFSDYKLVLEDSYRVATNRTHRPARRVLHRDRRLSTTPRDTLGTLYSTDFSGLNTFPLTPLPVGAEDILGAARRVVTAGSRETIAGPMPVVQAAVHGEVLQYERAEAYMHGADDVVLYDTRGLGDPLPGYGAQVQLHTPVGHYRFQEQPGATGVQDASGYAQHGTPVGAVQWAQASPISDPGDYSAGLNEHYGIYVVVPDSAQLSVTSDFSVSGWVVPQLGTPNLVIEPSFENALDVALLWAGNQAPTTHARQNTWAEDGDWALRITKAAVGIGQLVGTMTPGGSLANLQVGGMRVKASTQHYVHARFNVVAAPAGARCDIIVRYHDAAGAQIGGDLTVSAAAAVGEVAVGGVVAAPANAVYVRLLLHIVNVTTAGNLDFYVDAVGLYEGAVPVAHAQLRPRYDTLASKWRSVAGGRSYRVAYDRYTDKLVAEGSTDGTALTRGESGTLGLLVDVPAHLGVSYDSGTATFFRNGINMGAVAGLAATLHDATTKFCIGKWEADA
jgi:hypothetical protein